MRFCRKVDNPIRLNLINCINAIGVFSDNFFDMIPNEEREIEFFPKSKDSPALQFSIRSLGDLIKK